MSGDTSFNVISCKKMYISSIDEYKSLIENNKGKLILYLFNKQDPRHENLCDVIHELEEDFKNVKFIMIEYELIKDFVKVNTTPSLLCYNDNDLVNTLDGCSTSMLVVFVRGWCRDKSQLDTVDRIKKLLNDNPVLLFIKGDKTDPFCRFSRAVVDILNKCRIKFESYNIFDDPELREELKRYSNWPTYPQLYIKGNLIGGYDIIKELYENDLLINEFPLEFIY